MAYTKKDAAKETETTTSKVSETWHAARDDAAKSGELNERNVNDSPEGRSIFAIIKDIFTTNKDDN